MSVSANYLTPVSYQAIAGSLRVFDLSAGFYLWHLRGLSDAGIAIQPEHKTESDFVMGGMD